MKACQQEEAARHSPAPPLLSGRGSLGSLSCPKLVGGSPLSLSPAVLDRFDSNASASSSSNEGDSDREEKKRKQLKKAKMAKDRKSRKKPLEVQTLPSGGGRPSSFSLSVAPPGRACGLVLLGLVL